MAERYSVGLIEEARAYLDHPLLGQRLREHVEAAGLHIHHFDAAVGAGANQVSGPNLLASDQDAAYRSALKAAVAQARLARLQALIAAGPEHRVRAQADAGDAEADVAGAVHRP